MKKTKKTGPIIRIKTIIITGAGLALVFVALYSSPSLSRFFELSQIRNSLYNNATLLLVGLLLAGFGFYEIGRAIYWHKKNSKNKK